MPWNGFLKVLASLTTCKMTKGRQQMWSSCTVSVWKFRSRSSLMSDKTPDWDWNSRHINPNNSITVSGDFLRNPGVNLSSSFSDSMIVMVAEWDLQLNKTVLFLQTAPPRWKPHGEAEFLRISSSGSSSLKAISLLLSCNCRNYLALTCLCFLQAERPSLRSQPQWPSTSVFCLK